MKKQITVLYKEPYEPPREITIPNELEQFQKMVNGSIQIFPAVIFAGKDRHIVVICDEEAKLRDKKPDPNLFLGKPSHYDIVRGPVVVCAADDENLDGLTEDESEIAEAYLRMVEIIKVGKNESAALNLAKEGGMNTTQ